MKREAQKLAFAMVSSVILAGCVTTQAHEQEVEVAPEAMRSYLEDKPARAHALYAKVLTQGERNAVLNHMRAGLAAMELGAFATAEASFDRALLGIETIYADNPDAEAARSLWIKENRKEFKGEPYERAMAFYYRGLLYLRAGDYENARASFRGGMLQDTLAEDEEYSQDFGVLAFLDGWASQCNGDTDMAETSFDEALEYNAELTPPEARANLLLVAETGLGPRKVADGEYDELLTFYRGLGFSDSRAQFLVNKSFVDATRAEDIYFQASTRGGRHVDHVLEGKASFKSGADTVGDALITGGATTALLASQYNNNDAAVAGALIALTGLVAKGIAAATRPEADVRTWDNLPDRVHVATLKSDAVPEVFDAFFYTENMTAVAGGIKTAEVHTAGACSIGWVRHHSALDIGVAAPGS